MEGRSQRLAELRSYVRFTDADAALLASFRPLAQPRFSAIADEFYAAARAHEGAASVFKDAAQVERLHSSLQVWLGELLGGPYDDGYVEKRSRVGNVHIQVGLEVRYVVAAMSVVRVALQRIASEVVAPALRDDTLAALARVCDLDLAILLESYEKQFLARVERARAREVAASGTLAAGLAHEMRNPLNGAGLHVSVLERALGRDPTVPAAAREAIAVLRRELRRLDALLTDFMTVARPGPLARVECDANDLARAVEGHLAAEAAARGVTIRLERSPSAATARLDVERAKQALLHLVRNAIEAVDRGGTVTIRVARLAKHLEISVDDDGPLGVADPEAPIFDAFFTTKSQGTGLGLSIVRRVVSDHGGEVAFESRPGATTFKMRLPIDRPSTGDLPPS